MPLRFDLDFFPTLRELIMSDPMINLRRRNELRLQLARNTDGNVYRPVECDRDEPYPRDEA